MRKSVEIEVDPKVARTMLAIRNNVPMSHYNAMSDEEVFVRMVAQLATFGVTGIDSYGKEEVRELQRR